MNRLKKVFIVVATSLTMLSTSAILPVSASTINYGDTNNDGVVDLLDAVYLNKYLAGRCELSSYEAADVNCSYTVDVVDARIISAFVMMRIDDLPYLQ